MKKFKAVREILKSFIRGERPRVHKRERMNANDQVIIRGIRYLTMLFSDPFQTWANKESILKLSLQIICVWRHRQFMDIHLIPLPFHIKDIKKCLIKMDYFKVEEGH